MATKDWRVRGSVYVTGLCSIVLDAATAELNDQTDIKSFQSILSPGESLSPTLTQFDRVRSIVLISDLPVDLVINSGAARPNVRLLIEWAEAGGSLLDDITITNPVSAT